MIPIPDEVKAPLRKSLVKYEGYEEKVYPDSKGKLTVGIGYNLTDRGFKKKWIEEAYEEDTIFHYNSLLNTFPWFKQLTIPRQVVLINMSYNLGFKKFCNFKELIKFLSVHNYVEAAAEMLKSNWADQVGQRAKDLSQMILKGV